MELSHNARHCLAIHARYAQFIERKRKFTQVERLQFIQKDGYCRLFSSSLILFVPSRTICNTSSIGNPTSPASSAFSNSSFSMAFTPSSCSIFAIFFRRAFVLESFFFLRCSFKCFFFRVIPLFSFNKKVRQPKLTHQKRKLQVVAKRTF